MSCRQAFLYIGALLGNLEGVRLSGLLGEMNSIEGALQTVHLSLWELRSGNLEGGLLVGDPEGYERRALGMGTSLYGGSVGATWVRLIYWDFKIWLKGLWR
jgi:hypothetical protein